MSQPAADGTVDTKAFSEAEYDALLREARTHLPLYLQAAADVRHEPVTNVARIVGLPEADVTRIVATHVCLSGAADRFVAALPEARRRPASRSTRPSTRAQAVDGAIDWASTTRARTASAVSGPLFVTRSARRVFDIPENRTLVWALRTLEGHAADALADTNAAQLDRPGWLRLIGERRDAVQRALASAVLRGVEPRAPDSDALRRLSGQRTRLYRLRLPALVSVLRAAAGDDEQELMRALCERYFEPDRAWRLFEVVVSLRLASAFAARLGPPVRTRLLTGSKRTPFATHVLPDGGAVELVRAGWPPTAPSSKRKTTARRHGFVLGEAEPDLVARRTTSDGRTVDCVVIELKASRDPRYLAAGLDQLLRYLSDQPDLVGAAPAGWLVAPPENVFSAHDPVPGEPLWIATADEVAGALVDRMTR